MRSWLARARFAGASSLVLALAACTGSGDDAPGASAGAAGTPGGTGGIGGAAAGTGGTAAGTGGGGAAGSGGSGGSPGAAAFAACQAFCAAEEDCNADTTLAECERVECVNPVNPSLPIADSPRDCQEAMGAWWTCLSMLADPCRRDDCPTDGVASACF